MSRYIDANLLLEEIEDNLPINWTDSDRELQEQFDYQVFKHMVDYQPTADVVEVVRCKDCIHRYNPYGNDEYYCDLDREMVGLVRKEDYCSGGERRGENDKKVLR